MTAAPIAGSSASLARGIAAICLAAGLFTSTHVVIKSFSTDVTLTQLVFFRSVFAIVPLLPFFWRHGWETIRTSNGWLQATRGTCGLISMALFFFVLGHLPIADATAINFTMPLWVTALSVPLLKEKVGWRRWTAVAVGFAGVLLMVRPEASSFNWVYLAALGSALLYGVVVICMRRLGATDRSVTTAFYFALLCTLVSGIALPFDWKPLTTIEYGMLLVLGLVSGVAQLLMTVGYRLAPAAIVAPFDYTALVWAATYGYLLFGEVPTTTTMFGACIVIASGLYILYRETKLARGGRR